MEEETESKNISIPVDEIIWPKGRQIKKLIPKFGSNRNPATLPGWIKYDNNKSKNE